jgi:ABC-type sugar transport system substrate-binding protein
VLPRQQGRQGHVRRRRRLDPGVGQVIQKYKLRDKGVKGGGYDLLPKTLELLQADQIDFTIDQQPTSRASTRAAAVPDEDLRDAHRPAE